MNFKKLENPARIAELSPENTLKRIGMDEESVFFDYGAGTGVFTLPASRITREKVYAYDISRDMLDTISEKAKTEGIKNIVLLDEKELAEQINDIKADNIMVVTVYHHIDDKDEFFSNIDKLIKKDGNVSVIEFFYRDTPMGPGLSHRVHRQSVVDDFVQYGYLLDEEFEMGENFYLISFVKNLV